MTFIQKIISKLKKCRRILGQKIVMQGSLLIQYYKLNYPVVAVAIHGQAHPLLTELEKLKPYVFAGDFTDEYLPSTVLSSKISQ